jgi:hypothetical protein
MGAALKSSRIGRLGVFAFACAKASSTFFCQEIELIVKSSLEDRGDEDMGHRDGTDAAE